MEIYFEFTKSAREKWRAVGLPIKKLPNFVPITGDLVQFRHKTIKMSFWVKGRRLEIPSQGVPTLLVMLDSNPRT